MRHPISIEATIDVKYGFAMKLVGQAEADDYFEDLVEHQLRMNQGPLQPKPVGKGIALQAVTREQAETIERNNLGYFAGYYSHEVRARVEKLFRCAHPIFGAIAENGPPDPATAFRLGQEMQERYQAGKIAKGRPTIWERLERG
jgi:hypothetical protein